MFYGREEDLADLMALWRKPTASLVTCRGRRRIGKSTLVEEFARRSKARFVEIAGAAPRKGMTNEDQLKAFGQQLAAYVPGGTCAVPRDWPFAFRMLDGVIGGEKTIVFLDEISWMGQYAPDFPGDLKTAWDTRLKKHPRLILVLCGSVSTWIRENILNNTAFVGRASENCLVRELPLDVCRQFWRGAANRVASREIFDVLSVTGGVPRYLEELDPSLTATENIRRMCFRAKSLLRDDFDQIFNSVFGDNAVVKNRILRALMSGHLTMSEIASAIGMERGGLITDHLDELKTAGFVAADDGLNPATGRPAKCTRYRISDNYTRFYLKYILPYAKMIDENAYRFGGLDALPGWDSIMGLQFENLVVNNLSALLSRLGLDRVLLKSAAPWRQLPTKRRRGCQIDLLLQSEKSVFVVEIKRKNEIGVDIETEIAAKVKALALPRDVSVRTALVYDGHLSPTVETNGYIDVIIPAHDMLEGKQL